MRRPRAYELIFALAAVLAITAAYAYVAHSGPPQPSGLIGHGLGIIGFLLMLCTETLYTLRKNVRGFTWGSMRTWLQVHIFTGIVGPYLVLLHSAGKCNGLAGVVSLLTILMVVSGFIGRYIYTAAPRTLDGAEVEVQELEKRIAHADRQLQALRDELGQTAPLLWVAESPLQGWWAVLGRHLLQWRQRRRLHRALQNLHLQGQAQAAQLEQLFTERYRLLVQVHCLAGARRLLALWHLFHVPLGALLFTLAFIHTGAALYYATFLK